MLINWLRSSAIGFRSFRDSPDGLARVVSHGGGLWRRTEALRFTRLSNAQSAFAMPKLEFPASREAASLEDLSQLVPGAFLVTITKTAIVATQAQCSIRDDG